MSIQNILNQTALIAAGPLLNAAIPGVYGGAGITAGGKTVKFGYSLLPEDGALSEDGLVHVSAWGGTVVNPSGSGSDLTVMQHRVRMQLLLSLARSRLPVALGILTPFVEAYRDAFAAKVLLNGAATGSRFLEILDPVAADPLYPGRIAIEFVLEVTEKVSLTYAA